MTVTSDYRIEVSQRIKDEFHNGREYYSLQGNEIGLPDREEFRPDSTLLEWHNTNVFRG